MHINLAYFNEKLAKTIKMKKKKKRNRQRKLRLKKKS